MKRFITFGTIIGFLVPAVVAMAQPFPMTDVRALGMGGAFVAAGEGIGAVQSNPALLGRNATAGVVLPEVIIRVDDHIGLADIVDELNDLGYANPAVLPLLEKLDLGGALDVQGSAAAGAGFGVFGLSAGVTYSRLVFGAAYPDNVSTDPANLADDDYNRLKYAALDAQQIIFTGAKSFGEVSVGANLRSLDGTTYVSSEWLFSDPDTGFWDITEGTETDETAVAFDVGAVADLAPMLVAGIMAKDVNGPELGEWKFDPRYRIGAALELPLITVAADWDVTSDDVVGTKYQEWAVGAEFDVWTLALRAGLSGNSGLDGAPTLFHAGLGLGPLDIGAAYAEGGNYLLAGVNLTVGF